MKWLVVLSGVLLIQLFTPSRSQDIGPDIFSSDYLDEVAGATRQYRQVKPEEMVQNILQWLQGVYRQNNRKARQNIGYLPPAGQNAERPRPFQRPGQQQQAYVPPSNTYQPPSNTYAPATNPPYQPSGSPFSPSSQQFPDYSQSGYPQPGASPNPPFITPNNDYDNNNEYQTDAPKSSTNLAYIPPSTSSNYRPTTQQPSYPSTTYQPEVTYTNPPNPTYQPSYQPSTTTGYRQPQIQPIRPAQPDDDDDRHPPHIHAIDVQCAKDMMTINLEFNKVYNGIIYSKGFYNNPNCRYVSENSGQIKYRIDVSLNSCGTEFINGFETQGQSYLENVLVLQNEAGIQEVWDSVRAVRCLWEGNLNKQLSVALSVGMLNQEIVTFSGDTAMAALDIQVGRGPFAPPANGLVKIGETMTLVITITGDPGFDIQVQECVARDSDSQNVVRITDENGCVLKPKLFGAFQKTRDTGNTGASIIAYAFFNAFKFPDVMDLILECNVELCKTNCEVCPDPNQRLEPSKRRRRDTFGLNETLVDPITVGKTLKVILPEDMAFAQEPLGLCVSYSGFLWGSTFVLVLLAVSCVSSACMWLKLQRHAHCKNHM